MKTFFHFFEYTTKGNRNIKLTAKIRIADNGSFESNEYFVSRKGKGIPVSAKQTELINKAWESIYKIVAWQEFKEGK